MSDPDTSAPERRPPFARNYPRDPALDTLLDAFVQGNYAKVHAEADAVANSAEKAGDVALATAARDLRRRIEPDPMARWMLLGTAALLTFLVVWFYGHQH